MNQLFSVALIFKWLFVFGSVMLGDVLQKNKLKNSNSLIYLACLGFDSY